MPPQGLVRHVHQLVEERKVHQCQLHIVVGRAVEDRAGRCSEVLHTPVSHAAGGGKPKGGLVKVRRIQVTLDQGPERDGDQEGTDGGKKEGEQQGDPSHVMQLSGQQPVACNAQRKSTPQKRRRTPGGEGSEQECQHRQDQIQNSMAEPRALGHNDQTNGRSREQRHQDQTDNPLGVVPCDEQREANNCPADQQHQGALHDLVRTPTAMRLQEDVPPADRLQAEGHDGAQGCRLDKTMHAGGTSTDIIHELGAGRERKGLTFARSELNGRGQAQIGVQCPVQVPPLLLGGNASASLEAPPGHAVALE
mmetsp:Transcript_54715/g.127657  ORF Transcript_54715/g.127657 Transcript_54715/m.127657 type:complete len:307 (+) Transcript_54715:825-1745(+)